MWGKGYIFGDDQVALGEFGLDNTVRGETYAHELGHYLAYFGNAETENGADQDQNFAHIAANALGDWALVNNLMQSSRHEPMSRITLRQAVIVNEGRQEP